MINSPIQQLAPQHSAYLESAMELEEALLKAEALAEMACGEGGAVLRQMSDEQQDRYMWALAGFVRQAKAANEAMGQHAAPRLPAQGGASAKSPAPKAAAPAAMPVWPQTLALGMANAEHTLCSLAKLRVTDAEWGIDGDDWAVDTAIDLALVAVKRMRQQTYKDSRCFEKDWYQEAGVVDLATRSFSGRNVVYARTLDGLVELMRVVPELVEHSWE